MADDTNATPPPDAELRRLEPLVGTWKERAEDRIQDSVLGPRVPVVGAESFSWLGGGYFLVHSYETTFGDDPIQKGVAYWYTGVSTILRDRGPTAHAEVAAVRDACRSLGTLELAGATLACSCEPCPLCHAAAVLAGISRIVCAATKETAARHGFALSGVAADMQSTWRAKQLDPVEHVPTEAADEPFVRFDERAKA